MMGTPVKGDKSVIQNNFIISRMISISNIEKKEQTNREKYVFYCCVSQFHINPEKNTRKPMIMTV